MAEKLINKWQKVNFNSFFEVLPSKKYQVQKQDYLSNGDIPVVDQGQSLIAGYTNDKNKIFNHDKVIIFGDHTRIVKYIDFEFAVGADGTQILGVKQNINLKFAYYQLLNKKIPDTGYNRHFKYVKAEDYYIPPTFEEQQEIVDVLDAASEIIRLRTACIESAQSLIPALFQEMFGDPINNNKNYPCESLKKLCSKIGSGATPRGGKESYLKEGISFVRSMNVHDGIFQYKDLAFINDEQAKLLDNVELQESDVLINITGASVARTCIVPKEILPARVNQHVSILRCTGRLNPYFLNVLLYFQTTKQKLLDLANSKGATREAITKQQLELFKIILPPIEQQELFAEKVQEIEEYIKSQQAELENAKTMFQSLLHHSFTGELTRRAYGE